MNFKGTAFLLVLVAIGATVWFLAGEGDKGDFVVKKPDVQETAPLLAAAPDADDVTRVVIQPRAGDAIAFEREPANPDAPEVTADEADPRPAQPGPWRIAAPIESEAEQWVVTQLPRTLLGLDTQRSFAPGQGEASLADAGLETPQATVTLTAGGSEYTFAIGRKVPVSNDTYVLVTDADGTDRVHVVAHDFQAELARGLADYRSKAVFPRDRREPTMVSIETPKRTIVMRRADDGQWLLEQPVQAYADEQAAGRLVNSLLQLRIDEFLDDVPQALDRYGLAEPEMVLRFETAPDDDGQVGQFGLAVGSHADLDQATRFVKLLDHDWVASVRQTALDPLSPQLAMLRDGHVVRVETGRVERLERSAGDSEPIVLTKVRGEWAGTGLLEQLELAAVNDIVRTLADLRAVDFIDQPEDLAEYGLDVPRVVWKITPTDATEPLELRIGTKTPSGRNAYVQVAGRPTVLVVAGQKAEALAADPATLRSRKIFALRTDDITRIALEINGRKREVVREGSWQMADPSGAPIDAGALRDLLNAVGLLRANAVVAEQEVERFGEVRTSATLTIDVRDDAEQAGTHTLQFREARAQRFCTVDDLPYVFRLDPTVYDTLTAELIERRLLDLDAADVRSVTITDRDASLQFTREGETWTYVADPYVQVDPVKVSTLVERLVGMEVRRYFAYADGSLGDAGVDEPAASAILATEDGEVTLQFGPPIPGDGGRFGFWPEPGRVFQARPEAFETFTTGLEAFVQTDGN